MNKSEFDARVLGWQRRFNEELSKAPDMFRQAFSRLSAGDAEGAERQLRQCALENAWSGTALCVIAYLDVEAKVYQRAIEFAESGKRSGLQWPGYWYYYYALSEALNYTDQLERCLSIIDEAIVFFRREDSPAELADYLYKKSNILKQLAAPLSRRLDTDSQKRAKSYIIEGIKCIGESVDINSEGAERYLRKDLEPFQSLAARTLVTRNDLAFLDQLDGFRRFADEYFDTHAMACRSCGACFSEAQDRKIKGLRQESAEWFDRTIHVAPEDKPWDRCFKAFVFYQAGVNLLKLYRLEDLTPKELDESPLVEEISRIRHYWDSTLRLFSSVPSDVVAEFDKEFPPGIEAAVRNIEDDHLMQKR